MKYSIILVFFIILGACKNVDTKVISIKEDVTFLSDDRLECRQTGTKGEQAAADYIANRFKSLGLAPKGTEGYLQKFSFKPKTNPHQVVTYTVKDGDSTITGINVVGLLNNKAEKNGIKKQT